MLRSASVNSASYFSENGTTAPSSVVNTARNSTTDLKSTTTSKGFEIAKAIALRTLKALSKSSVSELQLDEVPPEFLFGESVDLHRWSMILNDSNLKELSEQHLSGKLYYLNASCMKVTSMFENFYRPMKLKNGLLHLNVANAKAITNYGITLIVRSSPNLLSLNLSGCSQINDIGLREVGRHCPRLESLNVSSCLEVDGSGLIAIAECCRSLLKLDISKCRNIQNWSIKKMFYDCKLLEDVNVSHLSKISDEEIRVLAQSCPNLICLHAAESPYVSDTGIQVIAEHCSDLDLLDVSRSEMQYRISDVSLMALGQKSRSLRTLRAGGCDTISDVGVNWLAEGCTVLEEIDFSGCTKVFMLSDPRLSAPKKGAKLEAWQAVIGIAALSQYSAFVETLDLSGCFRLNIALHQYVSGFSQLTVLNLAGCNQCSPEALTAVAKGCTQLVELNLSDCGKAANNKAVHAFGTNCKNLKSLNLSRCTHISGGGIKAVSFLRHLERLDLTGCKTLTDSMLIYLSEVDKVPALRTLSLVDVPSVTDSLLSWLSIKTQKILLMALKGTAITLKGLKSVKDRFPNSDMLQNDNFFGYWPKHRVDDRILINEYYSFIDAVTRVQGRVRKHRAIVRVQQIQAEWRRLSAQLMLQRTMRGYLARARTYLIREEQKRRQRSAMIITSIFRIPVARKKCDRRRQYLRQLMKNKMAEKIQLCWRKHRDRGILHAKRLAREHHLKMREFGALKMQSIARLYFACNRIRKIKALRRTREEVAQRKATLIQRNYRGAVARRITDRYRQIFLSLAQNRLKAAIRIQRKVRCIRTIKIINAAIYVKHHRLESCIKIQSVMRGALARIHVAEIRTEMAENIRLRAAIKIQTRLRMLKAEIELQRRIRERDRTRGNQFAAAAKIVGQARIKLACMRFKEKRKQYRLRVKEQAKRELDAICKIQAVVRGIKGRQLFELKLRDKKGKWKELFDEKVGKRFFYNKLSGEIRWRMPQDLLDLIPHPHCDNCRRVDATLECSICNELFCGNCFDSVHSGGRRKDHPFRALYDYYHKRLDYGDGEFPCKWPTEVIQDEIQGWMLRVAPQRMPLKKYESGWEAYEEGEILPSKKIGVPTKLGNGEKLFYFNRNTFEATYEEPDEVVQERQAEEAAALAAQEQQIATFAQTSGYYDASGTWINTTEFYDQSGYDNSQIGGVVPYQGDFDATYGSDGYDYQYYPPPTTANDQYNPPSSAANDQYYNNFYSESYGDFAQQPSLDESYNSDFYPQRLQQGVIGTPEAGAYQGYNQGYDQGYDQSYAQSYPQTPGSADYAQSYNYSGPSYEKDAYTAQDMHSGYDNSRQPEDSYYDYEAPPPQAAAAGGDSGEEATDNREDEDDDDDSSIGSIEEL